jgi:hypothetical protein
MDLLNIYKCFKTFINAPIQQYLRFLLSPHCYLALKAAWNNVRNQRQILPGGLFLLPGTYEHSPFSEPDIEQKEDIEWKNKNGDREAVATKGKYIMDR